MHQCWLYSKKLGGPGVMQTLNCNMGWITTESVLTYVTYFMYAVFSLSLYTLSSIVREWVLCFFHSYVSLYCFTVLVFDWGSRGCVTFPPVWKRKSSSELFMTFNYAASVLPKLCAQRIHVSSSPFCFTVVPTAGRGSKRVKEGKIWSCTSQTGSAKKLRLRREIHIGNLM